MLTITYNTAVFTPAGWRAEIVTAQAELLSPRRARVIAVPDIGGHGATGYGSRTGAKRQQYNVGGVATRETGAIKNVASLLSVEDSKHD